MTEYWLQKKTIGGWSQVTWYDNQDQAMTNFNNVTKGDTGYSWRLVEANTVVEKLLEEIVEVEAPILDQIPRKSCYGKTATWNAPKAESHPATDFSEKLTSERPCKTAGVSGDGWDKPMDAVLTHRGKGQIWVVNRATAHKTKIAADRLQEFEAKGYVKGGPRS